MGRWKRKSNYYRKQKGGKSASDESDSKNNNNNNNVDDDDDDHDAATAAASKSFSPLEYDRIKQYLQLYRDGCYQFFRGDAVTVPSTGGGNDFGDPPSFQNEKKDIGVVVIGPHVLPMLTPTVLSQPYLTLPSTFQSKHRRIIHDLCLELDLFHESIGPTRDTRYTVVSIYGDAFQLYLPAVDPQETAPPPTIPVKRCRPWFCQSNQQEVKDMTQQGRIMIEALVDQPGDCLRDDHDSIDLENLKDQTLSTITVPMDHNENSPSSSSSSHSWMMVDSQQTMLQCAQELLDKPPTELGFDLEYWNPSKYLQVTCLLQLSVADKDYVIDTLAPGVWDHVSKLQPLFLSPDIVKIGHCIPGDVKSLHRDFGIIVVNAFDTFEASRVLKLPKCGLAHVCQYYGLENSQEYKDLKALYQNTDWRRRPLTDPMIQYGRYDSHFLLALRQLMIRDLIQEDIVTNNDTSVAQSLASTLQQIALAEGDVDDDIVHEAAALENVSGEWIKSNPNHHHDDDDDDNDDAGFYTPPNHEKDVALPEEPKTKLDAKELRMQPEFMRVLSTSQQRCLDFWTIKTENLTKSAQYTTLLKQVEAGTIVWTQAQSMLLKELMEWRVAVAMREECLIGIVCPLDLLVSIAMKQPTSFMALRRIQYCLPELLQDESDHANELLNIVRQASNTDASMVKGDDIPLYQDIVLRKQQRQKLVQFTVIASAVGAVAIGAMIVLQRRKR